MEKTKPIKRNKAMHPISHDHHQGLLLCWKIRTGLKKEIEQKRIVDYVTWFYQNHLVPHFIVEEKFIFPILGNEHELVKQALLDHHEIHRILMFDNDPVVNLQQLEKVLEQHIRFEERVLFADIQKIATEEQMAIIAENHSESNFIENTADEFWNQR